MGHRPQLKISMKILTRYVLKEITAHSLLGLLVFTFVLYVRPLSHLLELLAQKSLPASALVSLFLLPLPSILIITIPMSVLLGTLIGLSRMAADGEIIAIRAAGLGKAQFLRPVMIFALLGWALTSYISLFLAPLAARTLQQAETRLAAAQVNIHIRPRVFIEQFPNLLLYVEDVVSPRSLWRGVFIADTTERDKVKVTLAETGRLVNQNTSGALALHLENGATHQYDPQHPQEYSVVSFDETDIPIRESRPQASQRLSPATFSPQNLFTVVRKSGDQQASLVELNYRLALPFASLVLALVALPLGVVTRKGGKAFGLMVSILLVFIYYMMMAFGLSLSKQGRLNPEIGLWIANVVFGLVGLAMLYQMNRVRTGMDRLQEWMGQIGQRIESLRRRNHERTAAVKAKAPKFGSQIFQILDLYVLRSWIFYLLVLLISFSGIYMIFDFFQLLGDIVRNQIAVGVILEYYWYLAPQVIYLMLPLSILVATLVSFGLMSKSNEITAIKSAGISLYRLCVPVLVAAGLLSGTMFVLGNNYLPSTNQRQDGLRNEVKGKAPQTLYRPDRQWIYGRSDKIYNYRFFDPDQNVFADLAVFEIDPATFHIHRRIYASRAFWEPHIRDWVLENGWVRDLAEGHVQDYRHFSVSTFKEINEEPAYFKKEVKPSEQMSVIELRRYIHEIKQSGFDAVRLSVDFYQKFSYPLIAFVVTLIAIPFSFSTGQRGALAGIALSIGIAMVYWTVSSLFGAMGNLGQLPPAIAAWSPDALFALGGVYFLMRVRT